MVANVRGYTPTYNFKLINFDAPRWHTLEYANWQQLDTLLLQAGIPPIRGTWANSTLYLAGDRVVDTDDGSIYRALVGHTSATTGTFAADRTANPSFWALQTVGVPIFRDDWMPGVTYVVGDIVIIDEFKYYLCTTTHVSSATFPPDVTNWTLIFDATGIEDQAAALHGTSVSSVTIGLGPKVFETQPDKDFFAGNYVTITNTPDPTLFQMSGMITSYIGTTLTVEVSQLVGAGTFADWQIQIAGAPGSGSGGGGDMLKSDNLSGLANYTTARSNMGLGNSATLNVGTAAGTVAAGDDARFASLATDITGKVSKTGDTMSGHLSLPTGPAAANAVRKDYVDALIPVSATAAEFRSNAAPTKVLSTGAVWTAAEPVVLTESGSTATPDLSAGFDFTWTLGGAGRTLANPTNLKAGQKGVIILSPGASGTITVWGTAYKFPGGVKPTLTASGTDIITYVAAGTSGAPIMYCTSSAGFA